MSGRGGGGGGRRRNPPLVRETPTSSDPSPSTPLTGGEFLLQLLRQPPKSQSSSDTTPIPIDGNHFRYQDPAVTALRPGVLQFSPPFSEIQRQQFPPWLLPHLPSSTLQNAGFSPPGFSPPLPPGFSQSPHAASLDHVRGTFPRGNHEVFLEWERQHLETGKGNFSAFDQQIESKDFGQSRVGNSQTRLTNDFAHQRDQRFVNGKLADGVSSHEFTQKVDSQSNLQRHSAGNTQSSSLRDQWRHDAWGTERRPQESSSRLNGSTGLKGQGNDRSRRQSGNHSLENGGDIARKDRRLQFGSYVEKEKLHDHSHVGVELGYVTGFTEKEKLHDHSHVGAELRYTTGLPHNNNTSLEPQVRKPSQRNERREGIFAGAQTFVEDRLQGEGFASKVTVKEDDVLVQQLSESLAIGEEHADKNDLKASGSRSKDFRSDYSRGQNVSNQRIRIRRGIMGCRYDIKRLTPLFLSIYKSLVPADEEIARQKQLLTSLKQLVNKEWPGSDLHLYGSCANSFGVSNSDIDICLSIDAAEMSKSDILLRLADILQSENFENVQALTRARVPIVKLMDPVSKISCDICVNNLLAVVNTKLLRDYAQVDERLRQLAFLVKHWAKSRDVNETYQGTLSSYAYVLMCIHFLQQRRPPILPCLQEMRATHVATVEGIECAFFDKVEELRNFGFSNKETIAELLWAFFNYWAFQHDYTNNVISVRTGNIISKQSKDWTKRIGNDRHLICIEDPFEISHDLGRVVDKRSIRILREEFERAANILRDFQNPSDMLFHPYTREC